MIINQTRAGYCKDIHVLLYYGLLWSLKRLKCVGIKKNVKKITLPVLGARCELRYSLVKFSKTQDKHLVTAAQRRHGTATSVGPSVVWSINLLHNAAQTSDFEWRVILTLHHGEVEECVRKVKPTRGVESVAPRRRIGRLSRGDATFCNWPVSDPNPRHMFIGRLSPKCCGIGYIDVDTLNYSRLRSLTWHVDW